MNGQDPNDYSVIHNEYEVHNERQVTCKICGCTGLVWRKTLIGWRLCTGVEYHDCKEYVNALNQAAYKQVNYTNKLLADLDEAVRLIADARSSVEFEVQENEANWGDRLQHKQEHAQTTLKRIDTFLAKHKEQSK